MQGQPQKVASLVRSCRRTKVRQARHISLPLSWLSLSRNPTCVRVLSLWDGKPCCVVIMHSTHKLTPEVHIIHQRRLEAWESWFLMIFVDLGNLNSIWLLPPTHTCGPLRKIPSRCWPEGWTGLPGRGTILDRQLYLLESGPHD